MSRAEVARSVPCRECGYDLRGMRVGRVCPECGADVLGSLIYAVDPEARRLPMLRDPRAVGDALVGLMAVAVVATVLTIARPVALALADLLDPAAGAIAWTPPWLDLAAAAVILLGLIPVWKLAPPRGKEPRGAVWRDIRLLAAALLAGGGATIATWWWEVRPTILPGAGGERIQAIEMATLRLVMIVWLVLAMVALRGVFQVIGERSREYRNARGGRQRVRDLIAAAIGVSLGHVLRIGGLTFHLPALSTIGSVVVWISTLMLLIGLCYLLANAVWIRASLRRPPPTLGQLLTPSDEVFPEGSARGPEG